LFFDLGEVAGSFAVFAFPSKQDVDGRRKTQRRGPADARSRAPYLVGLERRST
jgi:hypothetical protein